MNKFFERQILSLQPATIMTRFNTVVVCNSVHDHMFGMATAADGGGGWSGLLLFGPLLPPYLEGQQGAERGLPRGAYHDRWQPCLLFWPSLLPLPELPSPLFYILLLHVPL